MFIEIVRFMTLQPYNYAPKVVMNWGIIKVFFYISLENIGWKTLSAPFSLITFGILV